MKAKHFRAARSGTRTALAVAFALLACDDGPSGPTLDRAEVAGTYNMTALAFDPQGVLPEADVLTRLNSTPQLILTAAGSAQILYRDPVSGLFRTINGTFRGTETGVRIDFDSNSAYRELLLSRRMEFLYSAPPAGARTLTFNADAPDGVGRQRVIQLVPEWATEQLLDPAPGRLRVTFTE